MRSICRLSRRWHQQFCLSANFGQHQKCLQQWQTVRQYRQPPRLSAVPKFTPGGELKVREFEQYGNDVSTRKPLQPDPLDIESKTIKAKLDKLEKELEIMKQGPFGPQSEFMKSLPVDEREELLQALEAQGIGWTEGEDLFTEKDLELAAEEIDEEDGRPLAVTLRIPSQDKVYVKQFNNALQAAQDRTEDLRHHLALWKWYLRCQQKVQIFSTFVSEDVWNFLWESQQKTYPRSKHVVMLARDMTSAGVLLENKQIIDYIDALHNTGDTSTAIRLWEENKSGMIHDKAVAKRFWEVGIQLYAAVGRPNKAQEIAFKSFDDDAVEAKVFVTVMQAWSESKQPSAANRLWYCYLKLKNRYPDGSIPTGILGEISSTLLKAGHHDMSLAVFKDMLVPRSEDAKDSMEIYTSMLKQFSDAEGSSVEESSINRIGLTALLTFPRKLKNKFFFGAWVKWLIGEGKIDDAALVVELMQEHGVKPDAKHLNGIVGAWFREGTPATRSKAEQLAWAMIHSRIEMVKARSERGEAEISPSLDAVDQGDHLTQRSHLPRFLRRDMPPATIETFSILLLRYTRQSEIKKAEHLTEVMTGPADMKPNSFILNHWLYLSLRMSDLPTMWNRYCGLKEEIGADLETFAALWDGSKKNLDRTNSTHSSIYPNPRKLFAEMQSWLSGLEPKERAKAGATFSHQFYEQIIRCFCLSTDLHGTFVALRSLQKSFHVLPHEDIARMILMQVARTLPAHSRLASKPRRAAVRRRDSAYRSALSNLAAVMDSIWDSKAVEIIDQGAKPAEIEERESPVAKALRLDVLCTFLVMVMKRQLAADGNLFNELGMAMKSMNVQLDENELQTCLNSAEDFGESLPPGPQPASDGKG